MFSIIKYWLDIMNNKEKRGKIYSSSCVTENVKWRIILDMEISSKQLKIWNGGSKN